MAADSAGEFAPAANGCVDAADCCAGCATVACVPVTCAKAGKASNNAVVTIADHFNVGFNSCLSIRDESNPKVMFVN